MNLYIFRHGKTEFTGDKPSQDMAYGEKVETAQIVPQGIAAIERLGNYLKDVESDFNVSSTFLRCRQTVAIVEKFSGKKFEYDALLHDWDPRNETVEDSAKRIEGFYLKLKAANYASVCICTHGYPIAMLKSLGLKGRVDFADLPNYPTTGTLTVIKNAQAEVIDFNQR